MKTQLVSLPEDHGDLDFRVQQIVEFWNSLRICGDSGATTWEELERLEREVADCMAQQSPDVERAESLTAHAMLKVACNPES